MTLGELIGMARERVDIGWRDLVIEICLSSDGIHYHSTEVKVTISPENNGIFIEEKGNASA